MVRTPRWWSGINLSSAEHCSPYSSGWMDESRRERGSVVCWDGGRAGGCNMEALKHINHVTRDIFTLLSSICDVHPGPGDISQEWDTIIYFSHVSTFLASFMSTPVSYIIACKLVCDSANYHRNKKKHHRTNFKLLRLLDQSVKNVFVKKEKYRSNISVSLSTPWQTFDKEVTVKTVDAIKGTRENMFLKNMVSFAHYC